MKKFFTGLFGWINTQSRSKWIKNALVGLWVLFVIVILIDRPDSTREKRSALKELNIALKKERDSIKQKKDSLELLVVELQKINGTKKQVNERFKIIRAAGVDNPTADSLAREILRKAALQGFD